MYGVPPTSTWCDAGIVYDGGKCRTEAGAPELRGVEEANVGATKDRRCCNHYVIRPVTPTKLGAPVQTGQTRTPEVPGKHLRADWCDGAYFATWHDYALVPLLCHHARST